MLSLNHSTIEHTLPFYGHELEKQPNLPLKTDTAVLPVYFNFFLHGHILLV